MNYRTARCQCQKVLHAIHSKSAFRREATSTCAPPQMGFISGSLWFLHNQTDPISQSFILTLRAIYSYAKGPISQSFILMLKSHLLPPPPTSLAQVLHGLHFLSFLMEGAFSPEPGQHLGLSRPPPWLQEHIWSSSCCSSWTGGRACRGRAPRAAATLPGARGSRSSS